MAKSERPLELCGFDCQFSGKASRDLLVKDVTSLWEKIGAAAPDDGQRAAIVEALTKLSDPATWRDPRVHEWQRWHNALAAWGKALDTARPSDAVPEAELAFWRQFVASTSTLVECGLPEQRRMGMGNLRDLQMARNFVWLARTAYPQRKIIVWAASAHLSRNLLPGWVEANVKVTMGHEVWKALGKQTYTVAFTAAEGEVKRWVRDKAWQLDPPAPGSLEDLFVRAGCTNAFVDFRGLGPHGAWLKQKLIARPLGYTNREANWTDMFDGIVFTKKMFASTKRRND